MNEGLVRVVVLVAVVPLPLRDVRGRAEVNGAIVHCTTVEAQKMPAWGEGGREGGRKEGRRERGREGIYYFRCTVCIAVAAAHA